MNPIQPQIQNLNKPTIYPSFMNTSYNPQLDLNIPSDVNVVQDIPVALDQTTPTPFTTPLNLNENQIICPNLSIQAMDSCPSFQPMQDYHPSSLAHPQENAVM